MTDVIAFMVCAFVGAMTGRVGQGRGIETAEIKKASAWLAIL
jgi:hypothetical protein